MSVQRVRCIDVRANDLPDIDGPFPLGPLDSLVLPFIPTAVIFVYRATSSTPIIPIDRLQHAFSTLLQHYPHLTGRLRMNDKGYGEIFDLGSEAHLYEATCDTKLADPLLSLAQLPEDGNDLMAPYVLSNYSQYPLLTIQHTRFACGSVTLGIRGMHMVNDAIGFIQTTKDLVEIYNTGSLSSTIPHVPYLAKSLSAEQRKEALGYQPKLYHLAKPKEEDNLAAPEAAGPSHPPRPVTGRFFRYSKNELEDIKAKASGKLPISTFDAVCAHLHKRIYTAKRVLHLDANALSPPDILAPVDIRRGVGPPELPSLYTFNGIVTTSAKFDPDTVLNGSLHEIASTIHDMTRTPETTSREYILRMVKWLAAQEDRTKIVTDFEAGNGSLMISQWSRLDLYDGHVLDGVRPGLVSSPFTDISSIDGLGYLFPTPEGDGMDVHLSLRHPVWEELDKDKKFGGTVFGCTH